MKTRPLLVIGGSGAMGRHVIKHVIAGCDPSFRIDVFTRDPASKECRALQDLAGTRIRLVKGDIEDEASLKSAIRGASSVFCNTNYWSAFQSLWVRHKCGAGSDPWPIYRLAEDIEVQQGKLILELAREADVEHLVYSSLDAMAKPSGGLFKAPHFDAKARVEEFIEQRRNDTAWYAEHTTVLVTAPYMENFKSSRMFRAGGERACVFLDESRRRPLLRLRIPIGSSRWPMAALDDIGRFAAHLIDRPERWAGKTLRMASEALSMDELARTFQDVTGLDAVYEPYSLDEYRATSLPETEAIANMFGFIERFGIARDFVLLRELDVNLCTFENWLRTSGWRGAHEIVQKELQPTA
jgi:uncharacterized protein YbjT (DUF2867 family)